MLVRYWQKAPDVKQVVIAAQVFAFLSLLFVPSIVLVLALGYLLADTTNWFFGFIGITLFVINLAVILTGERRLRLWRKLNAIAGTAARS